MGKYYSVTYRNFLYPTRELLFDNAMCCCLFLHVPNIFHNRVAQTFAKGRIGSLTMATVTRTSNLQKSSRFKVMLHGMIRQDGFYRNTMLKQCCNHEKQGRYNVATAALRLKSSLRIVPCDITFRACLHRGGGPQVGGVTHLSV